jgi:Ni,Fe-hydrogenase III large subunit/Ni,Fe-hydrogenase III component G
MTEPRPRSEREGATRVLETTTEGLGDSAKALLDAGNRLALVAAHDDETAIRIVYVFTKGSPDERTELVVRLDPSRPQLASMAGISFVASRFEREMKDLFGVELVDHPQPRHLVLHQHWPEGWYPMRRGAGPMPPMNPDAGSYPFIPVEGPGLYEIPVGPVHAGLIEPGHFRFFVVGETILRMKARLWYVHKGIERLMEHKTIDGGMEIAQRISGDTAVGHGLAYIMAVEEALGVEVSNDDRQVRAALLEMERLYNHVADLGALCNDVAFSIANAHALSVRERLLRLNAEITGHRLLRDGVVLGGSRVRRLATSEELDLIERDVAELVAMVRSNALVIDRFAGTAVLAHDDAVEMGTLGVVARASGCAFDARVAHPFIDMPAPFAVAVSSGGDVLARFDVRVEEIRVSLACLQSWTLEGVGSPVRSSGTSAPRSGLGAVGGDPARSGVGIVEGWRGTIVHRVELDGAGRLARVKIVDPSWFNWPALPISLADTIIPDFPLANKSFNLSYAGNDL